MNKPNNNEYMNELISKIKNSYSLSKVLTIEEVNLPNRAAYKVAEILKGKLETNQLRKIFDQIKDSEKYLPDIKATRNELYKVLPLMAYAVGRNNCPKEFFNLLKECINEKSLSTVDDVNTLIDFLTSIVAYNKFLR